MGVFLFIGYSISGVASLAFLQYHFNYFAYPVYLLVPLLLSIYLPLSITFLLPIDYISHNSNDSIADQSDNFILLMWKSNYWTTFLLTWLVLPVMEKFYSSGHYNTMLKLKDAFRAHLKFQMVVLLVAVSGAIYLMLEVGLTFGHLRSLIIALSHIYALVLALWLMAHGLISVPRNRWLDGNLIQSLNHNYLKVPKLVDSLEDTKISFKEEVLQVLVLENNYTSVDLPENYLYRDWILSLSKQIPADLRELVSRQYVYDESHAISRDQVTEEFMTHLTYNFQNHLYKLNAYTAEFDNILTNISRLQTLIDAKAASSEAERTRLIKTFRLYAGFPKLNYYFLCYIRPFARRSFSVVLLAASVVIVQSEFFHSTSLSLLNTIVYKTAIHEHKYVQAFASILVFSYMLFCSLNSLTKLKIFNTYHLVPHNSDPVSACFYASYIARMTIPLSYNFITLFTSRASVFEEWYGKSIHLTGLFNQMNNWIPRLLLIPIVLTTFNAYDRIKNKLGLSTDFYGSWANFDDDEDDNNNGTNNDIENQLAKNKDLLLVEAKRVVAMEFSRRQTSPQTGLRRFNLPTAADDDDRTNGFDDALLRNSGPTFADSLSNRIDSYQDDVTEGQGLWGRLGGAVAGIRDAVLARFSRHPSYHDDPIDAYHYDDDANENVVL